MHPPISTDKHKAKILQCAEYLTDAGEVGLSDGLSQGVGGLAGVCALVLGVGVHYVQRHETEVVGLHKPDRTNLRTTK